MKKAIFGFSVAALALAGAAVAHAGSHGAGAHGMMSGADPMGDKTVTRAEAQAHAGEMFAKLDANKDGKLDKADREARHAAHKAEMFARLDANKDGSISKDEFAAAHSARGEGREGKHHEGMAPEGKSRGEPGQRGHGKMRGMGMMMLGMADANKDGAVSKDEFTAAHAGHFDKVDTDKDGKITPTERKAAHAKLRGKMRDHMGKMHGGHDMPPPPPAN